MYIEDDSSLSSNDEVGRRRNSIRISELKSRQRLFPSSQWHWIGNKPKDKSDVRRNLHFSRYFRHNVRDVSILFLIEKKIFSINSHSFNNREKRIYYSSLSISGWKNLFFSSANLATTCIINTFMWWWYLHVHSSKGVANTTNVHEKRCFVCVSYLNIRCGRNYQIGLLYFTQPTDWVQKHWFLFLPPFLMSSLYLLYLYRRHKFAFAKKVFLHMQIDDRVDLIHFVPEFSQDWFYLW